MSHGAQQMLLGKARAVKHHNSALAAARAWARFLARQGAEITIEDVKAEIEKRDISPLGNAAGAVFDGPDWITTGWRTARRPSAHARAIRVWKLKPHYTERNRPL